MALTVNTNIINDTDQYLLDAKNVKGGYVVVNSTTERDALPTATTVAGTLCYCTSDSKFYQYNGTSWVEQITKATVGLSNVDNTSDATKKSNFTGSIAANNSGFVTGGVIYSALEDKMDSNGWSTGGSGHLYYNNISSGGAITTTSYGSGSIASLEQGGAVSRDTMLLFPYGKGYIALTDHDDGTHTHAIASSAANGLMSAADKAKLDGIATQANKYSLPEAGSSLGGVKTGGDVTISNGVITVKDDSHNHVISNIDGLQDALDDKAPAEHSHSYIPTSQKGAANGVATLDTSGKIPQAQLPSYVDDIIEGYYKSADKLFYKESSYSTSITGETGKIYVDLGTNKTYRWGGSTSKFVVISETVAIGTTTGTALDGKVGSDHIINKNNPHEVTKSQVGLGSVVNTGDSATPVSGGTTKFTTGGAYTELNKKVDKVDGKGLSTNDYTTAEKNKLAGIASGAEVNVQSDWNVTDTSSDAFIKNKPTIPTVNNGTLTIQKNGTNVATFSANQSGNATANITVPTKVSDLTNDSGFKTVDTNTTYDLAATKSSSNGNVQLNLTAGGSDSGTDSVTIKGDGATTVTTDANGVVTISSTDTTYSSKTATSGGTEVSLVTTGEKYIWNNKSNLTIGTTSTTAAAGNHTHSSYVNQNAFSNVKVGSTTVAADTITDTLELAGSNVTITPDATNDKVTIGITKANVVSALGYTPPTSDTTYEAASSTTDGLMSKADKAILDALVAALGVTYNAATNTVTFS